MADSTDGERVVFILCEWTAGTLVYFSIDRFLAGKTSTGILLGALAILFAVVGVKWPVLKLKLGTKFSKVAATIEQIASNRLYRRVIYGAIVIAILATVGVRVYDRYHGSLRVEAPTIVQPPPSPPAQQLRSITSAQPAEQPKPTHHRKVHHPKPEPTMPNAMTPTTKQTPAQGDPCKGKEKTGIKIGTMDNSSITRSTAKGIPDCFTLFDVEHMKNNSHIDDTVIESQRQDGKGQYDASAPSKETISAPQGIAIGGNAQVSSPTVNNYGPPPLEIRWTDRSVTPDRSGFAYEKEVLVSVNTGYTPVSLAVLCDSEISEIMPALSTMDMRTGISNKTVGLISFRSPTITADEPLIVRIYAQNPFNVTAVQQWKQQD